MHDSKKSDPEIVPARAANKGTRVPAEPKEGRAEIERNPGGQSRGRTQSRATLSQAAERIRQFKRRKPQEKLTALLHHIAEDALRAAYSGLNPKSAPGVDGVTYGKGLEGRLSDLHRRVHTGAYRATPSRRVNIPKPDGGVRPLGVAALEDKIVQKAVVDNLLTPIYHERHA